MGKHPPKKVVLIFTPEVNLYLVNNLRFLKEDCEDLKCCFKDINKRWKDFIQIVVGIIATDGENSKKYMHDVCIMFIYCSVQHPCKHSLNNVLQKNNQIGDILVTCLNDALQEDFHSFNEVNLPPCHVLQTLQICGKQYCLQFLPEIIVAMITRIKKDSTHLTSLELSSEETIILRYQICDNCKAINSLLQKWLPFQHEEDIEPVLNLLKQLKKLCIEILQNDFFRGDIWNSVSQLWPNLVASTNAGSDILPMLSELIKVNHSKTKHLEEDMRNLSCPANLACLHGALIFMSNKKHFDTCNQQDIYQNTASFLELSLESLKQKQKRLICLQDEIAHSKCLLQWTIVLKTVCCHLQKDTNLQIHSIVQWFMPHINIGLEQAADILRHQATSMLQNVLAIAQFYDSDTGHFPSSVGDEILQVITSWEWSNKSVYIGLCCCLHYSPADCILQKKPEIIFLLLKAMADQTLVPYASTLYSDMASNAFANCKPDTHVATMGQFLTPLLEVLGNSEEHHKKLLLDYCLKKVLKLFGKTGLDFMMSYIHKHPLLNQAQSVNSGVSIMCLRTAQSMGFLKNDRGLWKKEFGIAIIKQSMVHPDDLVRLDAFCLICESWKPSDAIDSSDLQLLQFAIPYNLTSQSPSFRQELLNTLKKFLLRLNLVYEKLCRDLKAKAKQENKNTDNKEESLQSMYKSFVDWLLNMIFKQMFPSACFARRQISLHLLNYLFTTFTPGKGLFPASDVVMTGSRTLQLLNVLRDTYEENRMLALHIMSGEFVKNRITEILGKKRLAELRAEGLDVCKRSCKPEDVKDSAYHLRLVIVLSKQAATETLSICVHILSKLYDDVMAAKSNLMKTIPSFPLYGNLFCIRQILRHANLRELNGDAAWRSMLDRCVEACYSVFEAVFPVVGSVSPEGHLPEVGDSEDAWENLPPQLRHLVSGDDSKTNRAVAERLAAQRVLVACWRSAKETSLLLQEIAQNAQCDSSPTTHDGLLSWTQFLNIGDHLRKQIMEARHRGAFEVAFSAFKAYCPLLWRNPNYEIRRLPVEWINSTIADICDPIKSETLCATRRSAGLPFLAQALLGSYRGTESRACLRNAMTSLLHVANDTSAVIGKSGESVVRASKVHALNVMRGLVRDASLGEDVIPHLESCVIVAIKGFACQQWSVRNSSTLLFSALMTRIFGVKREKDLENSLKNRLSCHEFVTRFPKLGDFLFEQMKTHTDDESTNGPYCSPIERHAHLHPSLLILSRIYPSPAALRTSAVTSLARFQPLLIRCLSSPILKIREIAARALAGTVPNGDRQNVVEAICQTLDSCKTQNQLHGALLALGRLHSKSAESSCAETAQLRSTLLRRLLACHRIGASCNRCPVTRSLFLEVLMQVLDQKDADQDGFKFEHLTSDAKSTLKWLLADVTSHLRSDDVIGSRCPGQSLLDMIIGKLAATAHFWSLEVAFQDRQYRDPTQLNDAISCKLPDVRMSALTALEAKCFELQDESHCCLMELAKKEKDTRILTLIFRILSFSSKNRNTIEVVVSLCCHLAESLMISNVLKEAVIVCWANHIGFAMKENAPIFKEGGDCCAIKWMRAARRMCGPEQDGSSDELKVSVGRALLQIAPSLCSFQAGEVAPDPDLWGLLFTLLLDEDENVRYEASHFVHWVAQQCGHENAYLCLDSLALEVAFDCLVKLHASAHPERCLNIFSDVIKAFGGDEKGGGDDVAREARVFDRGETNTYVEADVIQMLVEHFRLEIIRA